MIIDYSEIMMSFPINRVNKTNITNIDNSTAYSAIIGKIRLNILSNICSIYKFKEYKITIFRKNKTLLIESIEYMPFNMCNKQTLDFSTINSKYDFFQILLVQDLAGMDYEFIQYCNDLISKIDQEQFY